jgi:hypothetical protein
MTERQPKRLPFFYLVGKPEMAPADWDLKRILKKLRVKKRGIGRGSREYRVSIP